VVVPPALGVAPAGYRNFGAEPSVADPRTLLGLIGVVSGPAPAVVLDEPTAPAVLDGSAAPVTPAVASVVVGPVGPAAARALVVVSGAAAPVALAVLGPWPF
jgi:hypothetical protein